MAKSCCRSTLRVTVGCCAAAEVANEGARPQKAATTTAVISPSIEFLSIFASTLSDLGTNGASSPSANSFLLDDREHLAVTRVHERGELLIVRLPVFVAHDPGRRGFEGCQIGHREFQHQRVEGACDIRQETRGHIPSSRSSLNGKAFLHVNHGLSSLPELQPEHVAYDDHERLLFVMPGRALRATSRLAEAWRGRRAAPAAATTLSRNCSGFHKPGV